MRRPLHISDVGELQNINNSKAFDCILEEHKEYLQKEVNRYVRGEDIIKAYGFLCKLDDVNRIKALVKAKIDNLKRGKNG